MPPAAEAPIEAPDAIEASAIEAPAIMPPTREAPIEAPNIVEASAVEAPSTMPPATQAPTTMPLPPEARYESLDALKKAINGFTKAYGYAFVIRYSRSMSSG